MRASTLVRDRAIRAAQLAYLGPGLATSPARMLPGFLIAGAQRCGTTSMYRALAEHPMIRKAVLHKGVHYFDVGYERGPRWYRAHFPLRLPWREAVLAFESSPYYLFHPLAGQRIEADLPGVRVIVLVRDPVRRAASAHAHELARGFETEPFERAIELEEARLAGEAERIAADPGYRSHAHRHHGYLARGRYAEQLERLERLAGAGRLHVVDSGDFFTDPGPAYDAVLGFLGLPHRGYPRFGRHNSRAVPAMPASLRSHLDAYFRPHDDRLGRWLPRPPSWRR